jgi:hypothetical protein
MHLILDAYTLSLEFEPFTVDGRVAFYGMVVLVRNPKSPFLSPHSVIDGQLRNPTLRVARHALSRFLYLLLPLIKKHIHMTNQRQSAGLMTLIKMSTLKTNITQSNQKMLCVIPLSIINLLYMFLPPLKFICVIYCQCHTSIRTYDSVSEKLYNP